MARKTIKKAAIMNVPQNRIEATKAVSRIGVLNRELTLIEAAMAEGVAGIKEIHEQQADPLRDEMEQLSSGVQVYCEANRQELTRGGKVKFHIFPSGEVKWRSLPAKVKLSGIPSILKALKAAGLSRFVRTKEEVNKDAILDDPKGIGAIKGITVGSEGETFDIEPHDEKLAEAS
ncbi:MAG: host-nuclease inhibitor Gam family protein [Alphaproteobacteria bacterium]|nr:host-nuclease inhibitor Gam family protein [Alphaproteobacteria bacterium]